MNEKKEKALQKAMRLCSRREKSAKDIKDKLKVWKVEEEFHLDIVNALYEGKFLDDNRYAQSYVNDKIYLSKWGKQKVFFSLKIKEIPEEIIQKAIDEVEEERYQAGLVKLLEAKQKSIKAISDYEKIAKLVRFGQSRGFTIDEVNKALNQIL